MLAESERQLSYVSSGIVDFLYLTRFVASLALKAFVVLALRSVVLEESDCKSLAVREHCEVNQILVAWKTVIIDV